MNALNSFPVVPLSKGQLLDVRLEDVVEEGLYRTCNTYRGGGGYDQFPHLARNYGLGDNHNKQFIVQLKGCTLDCPYCYVTRQGVWGRPVNKSSFDLVESFLKTDASVFHLMGGAPALYLDRWGLVLDALDRSTKTDWVFTSDFLLNEKPKYSNSCLRSICHPRALYAVDVKGMTDDEYLQNTRKFPNWLRFWDNLEALELCKVPYYITFTSVTKENQECFWDEFGIRFPESITKRSNDSFSIELIEYKALPLVDIVPWGKTA